MKKIFALMALLCAVLVAGVSCNDKKPDIKYQLDVEGLVANQSTPISAEFKAFVCNTDSIKIVASRNVSPVDQALIEASLEHQLLQTFGIKVQQGTAYDILVKGYVREANTGIAIYVDKRFTNAANPRPNPSLSGNFPPIHSATNTKGVRVSRFPRPDYKSGAWFDSKLHPKQLTTMAEEFKFATREEWLEAAVDHFRPTFQQACKTSGRTIPENLKVSIGFPDKGGMAKRRVLGQCWTESDSEKPVQIFINPTIANVNGADGILSVLVHELVHAVGIHGHGKDFKRVALAVGLEGKMKSTTASDALVEEFTFLVDEKLGPFPHTALSGMKLFTPSKKDGTRMLKAVCPECGYTIRLTKKWAQVGMPLCPCGQANFTLDTPIEEEG